MHAPHRQPPPELCRRHAPPHPQPPPPPRAGEWRTRVPRQRPSAAAAAGAHTSSSRPPPLVERTYDHNWRRPLPGHDAADARCRPVLALGKFDALHKGHQALAAAALQLGGSPVLLSFSGMAAVLGWPQRKPLVAPCDRARVLQLWAQQLAEQQLGAQQTTQQRAKRRKVSGGQLQQHAAEPDGAALVPVRQRYIPFAAVRSLSPEAFVGHITHDLRAAGVVAGDNYRFGYRAAGDTALLQQLCDAAGLGCAVVQLVGAGEPGAVGPVSSSKIREMLDSCRIEAVRRCLGRPYRLVAEVSLSSHHQQQQQWQREAHGATHSAIPSSSDAASNNGAGGSSSGASARVFVPLSNCLNQHPAPGVYRCCVQLFVGATARHDLLQLQQAFAGARGGGPGDSSSMQVLNSSTSSGSWCVRAPAAEVEVLPDGLLLPAELWDAAQACLASSSDSSDSSSNSGDVDPLCWDTDDRDDDAAPRASEEGTALLALDIEACLLQLCALR